MSWRPVPSGAPLVRAPDAGEFATPFFVGVDACATLRGAGFTEGRGVAIGSGDGSGSGRIGISEGASCGGGSNSGWGISSIGSAGSSVAADSTAGGPSKSSTSTEPSATSWIFMARGCESQQKRTSACRAMAMIPQPSTILRRPLKPKLAYCINQ